MDNEQNLIQEIVKLKARLLDTQDAHQEDVANYQNILKSIALAVDPKAEKLDINALITKLQETFKPEATV